LFASFEKTNALYENGASLLFIQSKDFIPRPESSDGALSEFAPFLISCDE